VDFWEVDRSCLAVVSVLPIVGDEMHLDALQSQLRKVCRSGSLVAVVKLKMIIHPNAAEDVDFVRRGDSCRGIAQWGRWRVGLDETTQYP
jgi:hypothetical protein